MGLPGSGKTTTADELARRLRSMGVTVERINADEVRARSDDWDFSEAGRIRQAKRIASLADESEAEVVIADFVAALEEQRRVFGADVTIFMDTITSSRFDDTNRVFERPADADWVITEWKD